MLTLGDSYVMLCAVASSQSAARVYFELGRLIREARDQRGLTQAELAASVGLTRTSVSNIEKGRQKMLLHTLYDFAGALGIEPKALLPQMPRAQRLPELPAEYSEGARSFVRAVVSQIDFVENGVEK